MQVYRAVLDDVTQVAVKYLRLDTVEPCERQWQQCRQRFAAEADILNACRGHPNICSFVGAWLGPVGSFVSGHCKLSVLASLALRPSLSKIVSHSYQRHARHSQHVDPFAAVTDLLL